MSGDLGDFGDLDFLCPAGTLDMFHCIEMIFYFNSQKDLM
jgi:hypothetical protein